MFGKTLYRYPKVYILISAIKDLWVPYVLQLIVIVRWALWSPNYPLLLISTIPCVTVMLSVNRFLVYSKMYDLACNDMLIDSALSEHPQVDKHDYLLWVSMEAYRLYRYKYQEEIKKENIWYNSILYIVIIFQLIFMPILV